MKINELLELESNYSKVEKKIILSFLLNCNKLDLMLIDEISDKKIIKKYQKLIKSDKPIQYLLKTSYFLDHSFYVNKNVLIPRFETEVLVTDLNDLIKETFKKDVSILDIGTGSGCIAISLSLLNDKYKVDAADISKKALNVARYNNKKSKAKVNFIYSDMFKNIKNKYDVIVSNPPYIYENDEKIEEKVLKYEPHLALFGGLKYYEEILSKAKNYLNETSIIALEIGYNEKKDINKLVKKYFPKSKIVNKKDLNGYDRYIYIINKNITNDEKKPKPSKEFLEALQELDYMEAHPEEYKAYNNIAELKEALLSDD